MQKAKGKIIYQDSDLIALDKPAGINSDDFEKRIHRLDKDTSGILLIAKSDDALDFFQKQFKERKAQKKYLALAVGNLKNLEGKIKTLIGRADSNRLKQKVYLPHEPYSQGKRKAITYYKVLQRFKDYDLIELELKTGRKHQIRVHFAYLNHPIAGDKIYGFKNQPCPKGLTRQFLHAHCLEITLPGGQRKKFESQLPEELEKVIIKLK